MIAVFGLASAFVLIWFSISMAAGEDGLVVTETGWVGIGTPNPLGILHVPGENGTPAIYLTGEDNIWFDAGQIRITTHDGYGNWQIKQGADNDDNYCGSGNGAVKLKLNENGYFLLQTASAGSIGSGIDWNLGLVQNSVGNVGIGNSNPQSNLHITKNANASASLGQSPAVLIMEQANNENWSKGDAAAEIIFKKGGDIIGAIRAEHMRPGGLHSYEDSGLSFYVAPPSEAPVAFEAMRIDHEGNVGIGKTEPAYKLDVSGQGRFTEELDIHSDADGIFGIILSRSNVSDDHNSWRIWNMDGTYGNDFEIWQYPLDGTPKCCLQRFEIQDNGNTILVPAGGNVGIGTTDPQDKLDVDGYVRANGTRLTSDARWKENIGLIENPLDKVGQLRGVTYNWIGPSRGEGLQIGVIAQEVEEIFPEVVHTDSQGYKSVEYAKLVAPLIEAVKALKSQNEDLQDQNSQLAAELEQQKIDFEQRLSRIENNLAE